MFNISSWKFMWYLVKNIYWERCIVINFNNYKFIVKYVYWMYGLRNI